MSNVTTLRRASTTFQNAIAQPTVADDIRDQLEILDELKRELAKRQEALREAAITLGLASMLGSATTRRPACANSSGPDYSGDLPSNGQASAAVSSFNQKGKTMNDRIEMNVIEVDTPPEQSIGERLRFKLNMMMAMTAINRDDVANELYGQLVEAFEDLD